MDDAEIHTGGEDPPRADQRTQVRGNGASDDLASAIASVLGGVLEDYSNKANAVVASQDVLGLSLDGLTGELDKLLEDAPLPFIVQHATRIAGIRKRVFALNSMLKMVQKQIDDMDLIISSASRCP